MGELRSHMPKGVAEKKKKKTAIIQTHESKFLSTYLGHSDKQLVLGEREPEKSELPKIWET